VCRSVSADRKKLAIALIVGLAGKLDSVSRARRRHAVHLQVVLTQTRKRRPSEFRGAAAAGSGVHDGEKALCLVHA